MKKYIGLLLLIIFALLLGFRIGVYYYKNKLNEFTESILISQSATELKVHVNILDRFRSGHNDNGIELLERLVDLDIATLGAHADKIRNNSDNDVITVVKMVKDYRRKYPGHTINSKIAKSFDKGFSLGE